jgi:hypothetical protein
MSKVILVSLFMLLTGCPSATEHGSTTSPVIQGFLLFQGVADVVKVRGHGSADVEVELRGVRCAGLRSDNGGVLELKVNDKTVLPYYVEGRWAGGVGIAVAHDERTGRSRLSALPLSCEAVSECLGWYSVRENGDHVYDCEGAPDLPDDVVPPFEIDILPPPPTVKGPAGE